MIKINKYGVFSIVIRNCLQYFKKAKMWGLLEQCVAVLRALSLTAGIIATQNLFEALTETDIQNLDYWYIITCLLILGCIVVGQHVLSGIGRYLLSKVSYTNMGKFMVDFQLKLGRLPAQEFENTDFLDSVERAKKCLLYERLGHFASTCLQLFTYYLVLFVSLFNYLFQLSPILPLVMLVAFIPAILGQILQMKIFVKLEQENAPLRRECDYYKRTIVDRMFYKETRILGGFGYFHDLFFSTLLNITKKTWQTEKKVAMLKFLLSIVSFIGLGISIFILFQATISGAISIGAFASVFTSLSQIFAIMDEVVSTCLSEGSETIAQVTNYYRLMDMDEVGGEAGMPDYSNGIVIDNVSYVYPGSEKAALRHVSFTINQGETIAIVGENGSGKSTLVRILIGLYTASEGSVKIGGCDTKTTNPKTLYTGISGVFQNYQRYKMTLAENVAISDTENLMDKEKIHSVLEESEFNADHATLNTILSPEFDGIDLSGGQWQRLAIARGLYRMNDFIVLDEPTAAIDPIEEAFLYDHFKQLVKDKCSILVTHRLGSVKIADRIVVMENGAVSEIGTHEELLELDRKYATMWKAQINWYEQREII